MLRSITISFVLFIGLFAINKVINYNSADNVLKKESIKIIDEIYSIKLASIIHEVETMKTPDNAQQLKIIYQINLKKYQ